MADSKKATLLGSFMSTHAQRAGARSVVADKAKGRKFGKLSLH
jgi:hypothetical protein